MVDLRPVIRKGRSITPGAERGHPPIERSFASSNFISQVRAQQGKKKISAENAAELITEAQRIRLVLDC